MKRPPTIRSVTTPQPVALKADDLLGAKYRDMDVELWDGTLWVHEPHGGYSGPVSVRLGALLLAQVEPSQLGWIGDCGAGFWLRSAPDRVLVPDVSFTSRARLLAWPREGFSRVVPDLVAEVRSPSDAWASVVAKGGVWLAHGVSVVWLVDPLERTVTTLRPAQAPEVAGAAGSFSGAPALPDLRISVADLFRGLP